MICLYLKILKNGLKLYFTVLAIITRTVPLILNLLLKLLSFNQSCNCHLLMKTSILIENLNTHQHD